MSQNVPTENITQCIVTIQGEGPNVGVPSLLVRYRDCNLKCFFCDTMWSNKHSSEKFTIEDIDRLCIDYYVKNILITGGEPFLYIDDFLPLLYHMADNYIHLKSIDIETNGTLHTEQNMKKLFDEIWPFKVNLIVSPKLQTTSHPDLSTFSEICRLYEENYKNMLEAIKRKQEFKYVYKYCYKFVYFQNCESAILKFIEELDLPGDKIYMMPLTPDMRDYSDDPDQFYRDFAKSCQNTIDFCLRNGFTMSCREHIWIYGSNKDEYLDLKES